VDCLVKATSEAELQGYLRAIAVWLSGSGYLVFDGDTAKRWQAKVYQGIDPDFIPLARRFTVIFECQPYAEDVDATTGTIGTAQDYGSDVGFYPVITINMTGSASSLQVSLLSTGEYVLFQDSLVNGNVIVFDMSAGKVTKGGVNAMSKVNIASLFFGVPPGTQIITVTCTGTYSASITYRKRYLYA
jgi:phage-related protein